MRKLTRKGVKKKVDLLFKEQLAVLKPKVCITCPKWGRTPSTEVHWGHLITATKTATRWDLENVEWQCNPCNMSHEYYPEKYTEWFIEKHGFEKYKDLNRRSNETIKNYDIYYKKKLAEIQFISP